MTRLIKMYFYRMSRSMGLIITLILCCMCVFVPMIEQRIPLFMLTLRINTVSDVTMHILSLGLPCAICAIYLSAVFAADYSNGFIKNIIPAVKSKSTIFFSQTVVTVIFVTAAYLLVGAFSFFCYSGLKGYKPGFNADSVEKLLFVYIMSVAFLMLINAMTVFTRSMVMAVIFAVASSTGITMLPFAIAESIFFAVTDPMHEDVVYTYLVSYMMKNIGYEFNVLKILAMCTVYIFISAASSLLILNRRDEK